MSRNKFFATPETALSKQEKIIEIPGFSSQGITHAVYPVIETSLAAFKEVLDSTEPEKGIDLEFQERGPYKYHPTIISITLPDRIASVPASSEARLLMHDAMVRRGTQWVAHSGISADKFVIEQWLGIETPLEMWDDSMLTHYICNQHLTKAPTKDDTEDSGALGFMNLFTMSSLVLDMWNWKECRGLVCEGPCPAHEPLGYCGVDSWAGLYGFQRHKEIMKEHRVPWDLYRDDMTLAEVCFKMEMQGVAVDLPFVKEADANAEKRKAELFPDEGLFNPKSPKQVVDWFKANNLQLSSNGKKDVLNALEKEAKKLGFSDISELEASDEPLPMVVEQLHKLYEYKSEGKGLDPWFGDKYLRGSFVHPRFISVGTSTGRLSSSRPNFQNVPARGLFGDTVRTAIVARSGDFDLLKSDFSNLELRVCLLYADVDQKEIGLDAFAWLVQQADGKFAKAAQMVDPQGYAEDPAEAMRSIAKRIAHAGDYLEGIKILEPIELQKDRVKKMIEVGALRPYMKKYNPRLKEDWLFEGGIVCFTGVNLADSLFGEHSFESRKKALEIQEDVYFNAFWFLREKFHIPTLNKIQETGYVRSKTGRFLKLSGDSEDKAKVAAAYLGQGTGAEHVRAVTLRYYREQNMIPLLQVHDELVFEVPKGWTDNKCRDFLSIMNEETSRLPGFRVPSKNKRGSNWKEMRKL